MRINNNQQQTSFKANTIVRFKEPIKNVEGLASVFARVFTDLEGKIAPGNAGKPFILDDGKSVLVPDISTTLGRIFEAASKFTVAVTEVLEKINTPRSTDILSHVDDCLSCTVNAIKNDSHTVKATYEDLFAETFSL